MDYSVVANVRLGNSILFAINREPIADLLFYLALRESFEDAVGP
jgi:hypothetical protein